MPYIRDSIKRHIFRCSQCRFFHSDFTFAFLMMRINTGAPISAVTIPDSNSPGLPKIRPIVSANRSKAAPPTADSGRIFFISGPITRRNRCGTIRPTKLIGPASAVVDAHKSTPAREANALVSGTFKPSPVAASSPSANVFSGAAMQMLTTNPITKYGASKRIYVQLAPPIFPVYQKRN